MLRFCAVFITGLSYLHKPPSLFFFQESVRKNLFWGRSFVKHCLANLLIAKKFSSTYYNLKIFSINTTKARCNILLLETVRQ